MYSTLNKLECTFSPIVCLHYYLDITAWWHRERVLVFYFHSYAILCRVADVLWSFSNSLLCVDICIVSSILSLAITNRLGANTLHMSFCIFISECWVRFLALKSLGLKAKAPFPRFHRRCAFLPPRNRWEYMFPPSLTHRVCGQLQIFGNLMYQKWYLIVVFKLQFSFSERGRASFYMSKSHLNFCFCGWLFISPAHFSIGFLGFRSY